MRLVNHDEKHSTSSDSFCCTRVKEAELRAARGRGWTWQHSLLPASPALGLNAGKQENRRSALPQGRNVERIQCFRSGGLGLIIINAGSCSRTKAAHGALGSLNLSALCSAAGTGQSCPAQSKCPDAMFPAHCRGEGRCVYGASLIPQEWLCESP